MSTPPARGASAALLGPLFAVLTALGFSSKSIFIKLAYAWHPVDAATLLALRMLFSVPFYLALGWWAMRRHEGAPLARPDLARLAGLGLIGYYLSSYLDFLGLEYISAGLERLVLFVYPTFVVVLSALVLRTRVTGRDGLALLLAYGGLGFAFWHDVSIGERMRDTLLGSALVLGSALGYAVYLIFSQPLIRRLGSARFTAVAMLVSSVAAVAQFLALHPVSALVMPWSIYALVLGMAVFATVLPTLFLAEAIKRMGSNQVALIGSIGPVVTIGLGALFLGEPVGAVQLVGAALVLAGVLLVSLRRPID